MTADTATSRAATTEIDPTPLTPRQAAFADAYARERNGAAAAREAGYARGSAKVAAARNMRRSGVLLRIMARRREQAAAREAKRARIAGLLDEAVELARARGNPSALVRAAALMMRLDALHRIPPGEDQLLADATPEQLEDLLACYEVAAGATDPELPDPASATVEELSERAAELMRSARDKAGDRAAGLPGVRAADRYLAGLLDHLEAGVRGAADACAFARLVEEARETGQAPTAPWWLDTAGLPDPEEGGSPTPETLASGAR